MVEYPTRASHDHPRNISVQGAAAEPQRFPITSAALVGDRPIRTQRIVVKHQVVIGTNAPVSADQQSHQIRNTPRSSERDV